MSHQVQRWQRGTVYKTGKRIKMWYGIWREDVLDTDGKMKRRQRNVKLGTVAELPTAEGHAILQSAAAGRSGEWK